MMHLVDLYETPWNSAELIKTLPITMGAPDPRKPMAVMKIIVPKVSIGDILDITGYCHVTNDTHKRYSAGYNLAIVGYLAIEIPQSDGTTRELELSEKGGCNVNTERHHEPVKCHARYKSKYNLTNAVIKMILYSVSSAAQRGQVLDVDQDAGRLNCMLFADDTV